MVEMNPECTSMVQIHRWSIDGPPTHVCLPPSLSLPPSLFFFLNTFSYFSFIDTSLSPRNFSSFTTTIAIATPTTTGHLSFLSSETQTRTLYSCPPPSLPATTSIPSSLAPSSPFITLGLSFATCPYLFFFCFAFHSGLFSGSGSGFGSCAY